MRRQDQQHQRHGGERFRGEQGGRFGHEPWRGRSHEQGFSGREQEQFRGRYGREDFESGGDWRDHGDFGDRGEGYGRESYQDRLSRSWGGPNTPGPSQWGQGGGGQERFGREDYGGGFQQPSRFGGDYGGGQGGGQQTNFGGPQSNWGGYGIGGNQANPEGWGQSGFGGQQQGYGSQGSFGQGRTGQQGYGHGSYGGQGYGQGSYGGSYGSQGQFGQFGGAGSYGSQQGFGSGQQGFGGQQGYYGQGQYGGGQGLQQRQGPKGYTRSDERIKDDVCERLFNLGDIDISEISVEVQNGKVTLEGTVQDRRHKHQIEDLVDQCIGVRDVENRIRVSRAGAESEQGTGSESGQAGMGTGSTRGKREQH